MTVDERFEQLEQQNQKMQRTNKRLTVALTMMAVAMCAVVTMAATGEKRGEFDIVKARKIWVKNDAGDVVVGLGANDAGNGVVRTRSAKGKDLVALSSTMDDKGAVATYHPNGKDLVELGATADGNGGFIEVSNKTGEPIVVMGADEYGNGKVGAYNRKGEGPELKPGP